MSDNAQDLLLSISSVPPGEQPRFSAPAPQIEGYQILEKLGEAGQGQVWRAVQLSTQRQVALKVPRVGLLSSPKTLARFEREVELAAQLRHPHIAQIFDTGVHQGLYYYAMDLIEGRHLDRYVQEEGLSQRAILELMKVICEAVQHAHQNGVIHRDLKPANILVTQDGRPYIVDFGLAKSLLDSPAALTVSVDGEAAGTPAYMSPEQALGHGDQIDTRTDVYSLGAILFTLLTGQHPHDLSGSHLEVLQRVAAGEVIRPRRLHPKMDRDLEALLLKALAHERDQRYSSAAGLAEDIDRYLHGRPLSATPRSRLHQAGSFVRRHRVGVSLGLLTSVLAIAAVIILAVSTVLISQEKQRTQESLERERQARADAQRQATTAETVVAFLTNDVLASADPARTRGRQVTVRQMLDAAARTIATKLAGEPLVEAAVHQTLGDTYLALGEYADAARHHERARRLYQDHLGDDDPRAIRATASLAGVYLEQKRYPEAEPLLLRSLETAERTLGEEDRLTLACMNQVALLFTEQGDYDRAESLFMRALALQRRVFGEADSLTLQAMLNLGALYDHQGRYREGETLYRDMVALQTQLLGTDHPDTLLSRVNLAKHIQRQGRVQEAQALYVDTLEIMKRVLGSDHPDNISLMLSLARLYESQGRFPDAELLWRKMVEISEQAYGAEHEYTLGILSDFGRLYCDNGRLAEAEALLVRTLRTMERVLGEAHPHTFKCRSNLAILRCQQGRYPEAKSLYRRTVELSRRTYGEEHPATWDRIYSLARLCRDRQHYQDAEPLYRELVETKARALGPEHAETLWAANGLAGLYCDSGRLAEAEPLFLRTVETMKRVLGEAHPYTLTCTNNLGILRSKQGQEEEARSLWLASAATAQNALKAGHPEAHALMHVLVSIYRYLDQPEEARKWEARLSGNKVPLPTGDMVPLENLGIPTE